MGFVGKTDDISAVIDKADFIIVAVAELLNGTNIETTGRSCSQFLTQILAYAITIHKSQSSEFPVVVMPVLTQHFVMLQRNLIYTGMTRAKKLLILIGPQKAVKLAVQNTRKRPRFSNLARRLREEAVK